MHILRNTNIYHNLVIKENALTELLANLLQFSSFKEVFAKFVADKVQLSDFSFQYADVKTQIGLGELGRPDLVIENESFCIFIECKVTDYQKLTPNQPLSYLKYLGGLTNKKCALIFLLPYYYEHEDAIRQQATSFASAASGSEIQPQLVYWNELIAHIETSHISDQNVAIEHFVLLLHSWFDFRSITFSEEDFTMMLNKEIPTLLLKLISLVNEVEDKVSRDFKTEELFNEYGFGYYVKNQKGEILLWFGCEYDFWRDYGSSLQIGVGDDEFKDFSPKVINRFKEKFGKEVIPYESWNWFFFPIPTSLIEDQQKVKNLARLITETAEFCNSDS